MSPFLNALIFCLLAIFMVLVSTFIFNLITRYKIWSEITKGNMAVAFSTGGFIFGVANIIHFAISTNDNIVDTLAWGGFGVCALIVIYFLFEILTPKLNVFKEIAGGNKAVGFISLIFSVSLSYIIGACIL